VIIMALKDKMMERALGSVTTKAIKGLVPLMESIHTYMELQAAYLEQILKIQLLKEGDKEHAEKTIKNIRERIIEPETQE